ncbi:hypothetical protein JCM9279_000544 [Rhodotorula babjevae]
MPDTDYDDLPSPPRARSHSRTIAASAAGRLYGRKAARKPVGGSAHSGGAGGASGEAGSGGDSSASDEATSVAGGSERSSRSARSTGGARGQVGRAGKVTRRGKERAAEEGSEDGDDDEIGQGLAPGGSSRKLHSTKPASGRPSSTSAKTTSRSGGAGDATTERAGRAKCALAEEDEQDKRSRSSAATPQRARSSRGSSPSSSPRKRALGDKSNLTADSPRKISRTRPSQLALPGPSSGISSSRSPGGSSLSVFRDQPSTSAAVHPASSSSSRLAPPAPSASATAQSVPRPRAPRAAQAVAGSAAAQSLPHRPLAFSSSFLRSPSPDLAAAGRQLNPPPSPRAPQHASPARLAVPGGSRPSLGAPGMPAPWALAAPAGEHSSSPRRAHEPLGEHGAPVFRYTTSEFDDAPSLRLSPGGPGGGGIEDDGAGMESSIVLETWEDEQSRRSAVRARELEELLAEADEQGMADDEGGGEEEEGDKTLRPGADLLPDLGEDAAMPMGADDEGSPVVSGALAQGDEDEGGEDEIVLVGLEQRVALEPIVEQDPVDEDDADDTIKALAPLPHRVGLAQTQNAAQQALVSPDESAAYDRISPDRASSSSSATAPRPRPHPRPRSILTAFSASSMPPRVPRPSVDEPLDDGPPSDEDPLGYALRTTGTFSSEDDLPDSAPSDESALEDYLAEREVGRAVKPTSGQREKRVAASARAKRLRLKEGAREGLERHILDVDEAKAGSTVQRLIEMRARGAEEEEEHALEAMRRQKKRWITG